MRSILTLLLSVLCLRLTLLSFCSACDLPTENNPISVCAYCSDNHAGVRWMVHESNENRGTFDREKIDTIGIEFKCSDPENNMVVTRDDCFNGGYLSSPLSIRAGEWRWHILERQLNEGTECNFTTTVENSFYFTSRTLNTSTCTVKSPLECYSGSSDCVSPAICSGEPGNSICSCSCRDGFSEDLRNGRGLLCKSIQSTITTSISHGSSISVSPTIPDRESVKLTTVLLTDNNIKEGVAGSKLLVIIPISVIVPVIILALILLMFIIARNRYYSSDSVNKILTSWQVHDKFDPDFVPAVKIDKTSAVKQSLESIFISLEKVADCDCAQGEHVLGVGKDTKGENSCDISDQICVKLWHDETVDSGILSSSCSSSSSSSNSKVTPINGDTTCSDQVEYSSSASGLCECETTQLQESLAHSWQTVTLEHNSPAINVPSSSANSLGRTSLSSNRDYATESGDQVSTDLSMISHACTKSCDPELQHTVQAGYIVEMNNVCVSSLSQRLGETSDAEILSDDLSCSFDVNVPLTSTLPDVSTNGQLMVSIEHNATSTWNDNCAVHDQVTNKYYVRSDADVEQNLNCCDLQVSPMYAIDEPHNTSYQRHEEGSVEVTDIINNKITMLAHESGFGGSTLSLIFDTEY